ncbi:MAG: MBL fold metallo-hydrolase [bacterium]|nr:MBL fold metallo-hydrolase [bacterium]
MRRSIFTIFIILLAVPSFSQQEIKTEKISDRVIVVKLITQYGALNVTAVSTEKGLVVIDTAYPPAETSRIRETIENETGRNDFTYLINTHGHTDHASGNQVFKDAVIIGHENILTQMETTNIRKEQIGLGEEYVMTPPDIRFNEMMTLNSGDVTFEMFYLGNSHTDAHIIIYIPEEKLLCVGDTFDYNYLPWIDSKGDQDVEKWITVLGKIFNEENEISTVIGGHREVFTGDLIKAYYTYLNELWIGVENSISADLTLETTKDRLLKSISREAFGHLKSTDEDYLRNIEGVWNIQKKKE